MGGSYTTIFETENYRWTIYENHTDAYRTYELVVFRKKDDEKIERRTSGSWGEEVFMEFDVAFDELEKEIEEKYNYQKLTKEQICLSEIYGRMIKAETSLESYKRRYEDIKTLFDKIKEVIK